MKILLLGPNSNKLANFILAYSKDELVFTEEPISIDSEYLKDVDFIISYGYKHIIKSDVIKEYQNKIINLHISCLPWNRGADPNLWSFLENTPKGVTIHYIDCGVDTGNIIAQKEVCFSYNETLRSSYDKLCLEIEKLFQEVWPKIRSGRNNSIPQIAGGTFHQKSDRKKVENLLTKRWDTPVSELIGKYIS